MARVAAPATAPQGDAAVPDDVAALSPEARLHAVLCGRQVLIAEEARSALVRTEAAYTDASQRLLAAPAECSAMGSRAAAFAGRHGGATVRTLPSATDTGVT